MEDANMSTAVASTVQRLLSSGIADEGTVRGCSPEEIKKLEKETGLGLPERYREFLLTCGNGAGGFMVGSDWQYAKLFSLRKGAQSLLKRCKVDFDLPAGAFVFIMHQGYQFLYLDCANGDDPPVYLFIEGSDPFRRVYESFSSWFAGCVEDEIVALRKLQSRTTSRKQS
jgi:hypothetical protein